MQRAGASVLERFVSEMGAIGVTGADFAAGDGIQNVDDDGKFQTNENAAVERNRNGRSVYGQANG